VAQEIGPGSINHTAKRWDFYGADPWQHVHLRGAPVHGFGDTFGGPAATPFFSVAHSDWRSNTMAYVASSAQPVHGLYFQWHGHRGHGDGPSSC